MPQLLSQDDTPGSAVTVAELMRRCAPLPSVPETDDEFADDFGVTTAISVDALLKREGRTDLAPGRPMVIAGWTVPGPLVRRGAIAAGALLAVGTVFGLTGILNAASHPPVENGSYTEGGPLETVTDPAANTVDTPSELPTTDPQVVTSATATPVVVPVALSGSQIARHALVPVARPTQATSTTPAAPPTTSGAPTSTSPPADDAAAHTTPTTAPHHDSGHDAQDGSAHSPSPTTPPRPTTPPFTPPPKPTTADPAPTIPTSAPTPTNPSGTPGPP